MKSLRSYYGIQRYILGSLLCPPRDHGYWTTICDKFVSKEAARKELENVLEEVHKEFQGRIIFQHRIIKVTVTEEVV